ncbi:hypothetical protein QVD17_01586 [Tagetes erecta]|uniref:Uncharacterized protein n=1 Tax=Tagetes erecta TaxID=13708 RepID=A0AAD8L6M7_TARER|nr:hypothetical protein QVD17_01586 [Tagetes erecta]
MRQTIVALISRATSVSQFLYKATVTGAQEYHGWFYVKCNSCGKTRKVEACSYVCAHFNVPKEPNYSCIVSGIKCVLGIFCILALLIVRSWLMATAMGISHYPYGWFSTIRICIIRTILYSSRYFT